MKDFNWKAYISLIRPANLVTAMADIFAGWVIAHSFHKGMDIRILLSDINFLWLCIATVCLYGGGVVFNDVFDADLDKVERPERPIPSGKVSGLVASLFAIVLFIVGLFSAYQVSQESLLVAMSIVVLALVYNIWAKHILVLGPLFMGGCRGANFILGLTAVSEVWLGAVPVALISFIYIFAVTLVSQQEVYTKNIASLKVGMLIYALVNLSLLLLCFYYEFSLLESLPFQLLFSFVIFKPLYKAVQTRHPSQVKKAVKAGVLSLVVYNATLVAGFVGWPYALILLMFLPLSLAFAKLFAVT